MFAHLVRAPVALTWMLAAGLLCSLDATGRTCAAPSPPPSEPTPTPPRTELHPSHGAARRDRLYRQVKVFDFDERPLGNYEDTPMYWRRFDGAGLPLYSSGQLDEEVGHTAPPSFRLTLRGGNVGYEYGHTDLVIFPDSDYLLEGFVRAEGLEHARAFLACHFVDGFGQRIDGSEQVSNLVRSGPPVAAGDAPGREDGVWQRVTIPLVGDFPTARSLRVQVWVLQRHVWQAADTVDLDPIERQDVDARVWFDDIAVHRMPRVRIALSNPGGLVRPGAREQVQVDVHNATLATVRVETVILDVQDAERFRSAAELEPQATEALRIPFPELPAGLYRTRVQLVAEQEMLVERTLRFAVLPELGQPPVHEPELGVDVGLWPSGATGDESGAYELIAALDVGAVKVGVPMIGTPTREADLEYLRQIRDLGRRLARAQIRTTGVVLSPTAGRRPDDRNATWRMVTADERWETQVGPVFAYFGGYLMSWQLGDEQAELSGTAGWTGPLVEHVRRTLERFVAAPELVVPRAVFDAPPAAPLLAFAPPNLGGDDGVVIEAPHAFTYWLGPEVPARLFPWQLAFWADDGPRPAGPAARRGAAERWLSLGFDRDALLTPTDRLADMARRIVLVKAVNPDRLYVPAPFEVTAEGGGATWQPTEGYIPLRTLFHHLAGQRAVAALTLEHDAVAVLFSDGQRHTLIVWTWQADADGATADLYLGDAATAVDLFSTAVPLTREDARVRIPLSPVPLIIRDVDAPLLLLQASLRVEPSFIQLHSPEPRPVLMLRNYYDVELAGTITLHPPKTWEVTPSPFPITVPPGGELEQPLFFTIPPRQVASEQTLGVDLELSAPRTLSLHFDVRLQILLRDIVVQATAWWEGNELVVEQTLHNLSPWPVSFNAFCQALNRAQAEGVFLDVPPGALRTAEYRFPAARDLAGTRLWLGIREINGRRTLDQLVAVPR